jgi:hypothetical protein
MPKSSAVPSLIENSYRGSASASRPSMVTGSTMHVSAQCGGDRSRTVIPRWYSSPGRRTSTSVTGTHRIVATQTARDRSSGLVVARSKLTRWGRRLVPPRAIGTGVPPSCCHATWAAPGSVSPLTAARNRMIPLGISAPSLVANSEENTSACRFAAWRRAGALGLAARIAAS